MPDTVRNCPNEKIAVSGILFILTNKLTIYITLAFESMIICPILPV